MKTYLFTLEIFLCIALFSCKDACKDIQCKNGGTAVDSGGKCMCNCKPGYEGEFCEMQTRQKILGDFTVTSDNQDVTIDKNFSIITSGTFEDRVHINLYYYGMSCGKPAAYPNPPYAIVNKNTLTMPAQPYHIYDEDYTISGEGTIHTGQAGISIDLTINVSPSTSCFKTTTLHLTKIE